MQPKCLNKANRNTKLKGLVKVDNKEPEEFDIGEGVYQEFTLLPCYLTCIQSTYSQTCSMTLKMESW